MSEKKQTALSNSRYCIKTQYTNDGQNREAKLKVGWYANNPQLVVNLGLGRGGNPENNYGNISISLSHNELNQYFELLLEALELEQGKSFFMDYYATPKERGTPAVNTHRLLVGKDTDGRVWTSLYPTNDTAPKVKFTFSLNDRLTKVITRDKTPIDPTKESAIAVRAFIRTFSNIVGPMAVAHYEQPRPPNGGGGYNNRQNSSPAASSTPDEDIPF